MKRITTLAAALLITAGLASATGTASATPEPVAPFTVTLLTGSHTHRAANLRSDAIQYRPNGTSTNWCMADPSAGGPGVGMVLWGCQTATWFGWTINPINYGTYAGQGDLLSNDATGNCLYNDGSSSHRLTTQACNWNNPNEVWIPEMPYDGAGAYNWVTGFSGPYGFMTDANGDQKNGNWIVGWTATLLPHYDPRQEWSL